MSNFVVPKETTYKEILQQIKEEYMHMDSSSTESVLYLLQFITQFSSVVEKYFAHYGLSQGRFIIMILLFTYPKITWTPATLAENMGITRASITGLLDGVEKSGLVERKACPQDRRRLIITLTQKGKAFLKEMLPEHFQRTSQFMSILSKEEQCTLKKILEKVSQGFPLLINGF